MSVDRRVTVKFWQLNPSDDKGIQFSDSLAAVFTAAPAKRVVEIDGARYQFEPKSEPTPAEPFYLADVIRLQSDGLPSLVKAGEKARQFTLAEDDNLGHHTGLIFQPDKRLLGFEIKPSAAGVVKVLMLVADVAKHPSCIPLPVLTKNAIDALAKAKNGKLTFRVADPASMEAIKPEFKTMKDNLAFLKGMVDGSFITVTIGVGPRSAKGLKMASLESTVEYLVGELAQDRGNIKAIQVTQPGADEPLLDFIKAQFKNSGELPLSGNPDTDWTLRENFLKLSLVKARQHVH